jgi:hypothetical protein
MVKPQLLKDGGKVIKHINFNKELYWRTPKWAHVGLHIDGIGVKRKGTCNHLIVCQDENGHDCQWIFCLDLQRCYMRSCKLSSHELVLHNQH